jgi:hypothetical protein
MDIGCMMEGGLLVAGCGLEVSALQAEEKSHNITVSGIK